MDKDKVRELALSCGFKLKEQTDGSFDLNQYVFDFADALARHAIESEQLKLMAAQNSLNEANRRLCEIDDCLNQKNLHVIGWHLNGDAEPLSNFFANNLWEPVE